MPIPEAQSREKFDEQLIAFGHEHADTFGRDLHPDIRELKINVPWEKRHGCAQAILILNYAH